MLEKNRVIKLQKNPNVPKSFTERYKTRYFLPELEQKKLLNFNKGLLAFSNEYAEALFKVLFQGSEDISNRRLLESVLSKLNLARDNYNEISANLIRSDISSVEKERNKYKVNDPNAVIFYPTILNRIGYWYDKYEEFQRVEYYSIYSKKILLEKTIEVLDYINSTFQNEREIYLNQDEVEKVDLQPKPSELIIFNNLCSEIESAFEIKYNTTIDFAQVSNYLNNQYTEMNLFKDDFSKLELLNTKVLNFISSIEHPSSRVRLLSFWRYLIEEHNLVNLGYNKCVKTFGDFIQNKLEVETFIMFTKQCYIERKEIKIGALRPLCKSFNLDDFDPKSQRITPWVL